MPLLKITPALAQVKLKQPPDSGEQAKVSPSSGAEAANDLHSAKKPQKISPVKG
jgi:hypothetical protein